MSTLDLATDRMATYKDNPVIGCVRWRVLAFRRHNVLVSSFLTRVCYRLQLATSNGFVSAKLGHIKELVVIFSRFLMLYGTPYNHFKIPWKNKGNFYISSPGNSQIVSRPDVQLAHGYIWHLTLGLILTIISGFLALNTKSALSTSYRRSRIALRCKDIHT